MKDIPKHILVTVIIMVVLGLLGGGAWYWSSQKLTEKIDEKNSLDAEIKALEKKGLFPSAQNKKTLEDQKAKLKEVEESLKPQLAGKIDLFSSVRSVDSTTGAAKGLDPDGWKKAFGEKRQELRQLAKDKNLIIPDEYNFGFKSYVLAAPRSEHTLDLGVQLVAIEELTKIMAGSGIDSLIFIKRSMIEEARSGAGANAGSGGGGGGAGTEEGLNAKVIAGPEGIYRVMPFEVSLKSDPQSIVNFLNGLGASKFTFVTRFVYLENEKTAVPKRSEVTAVTAGGTEAKKNFISVAGQEKVNARIRIDLIDLLPPVQEAKQAPKPKK